MLDTIAAGNTFPIPSDGRVHAADLSAAATVYTALFIYSNPEKRLPVKAAVGCSQGAKPAAERAIWHTHQSEKDDENGKFPKSDGTGGGSKRFVCQEERHRPLQCAGWANPFAEGRDTDAGHAPKEQRQNEDEECAPDILELAETLRQR